jgi:hypothetical protein
MADDSWECSTTVGDRLVTDEDLLTWLKQVILGLYRPSGFTKPGRVGPSIRRASGPRGEVLDPSAAAPIFTTPCDARLTTVPSAPSSLGTIRFEARSSICS